MQGEGRSGMTEINIIKHQRQMSWRWPLALPHLGCVAASTRLNLECCAYAITGCRCVTPTNSDAVNTTAKAVSVNQRQNSKENNSHINLLVLECCYIWVRIRHLCVLQLMFFFSLMKQFLATISTHLPRTQRKPYI